MASDTVIVTTQRRITVNMNANYYIESLSHNLPFRDLDSIKITSRDQRKCFYIVYYIKSMNTNGKF